MCSYYTVCIYRSGSYSSIGTGKRQLKSQGTSKIDNICPAHMKVQQDIDTSKVVATYVSAHWNHTKQLRHLPIPHSVRLGIASQLQQGVPILKILDKFGMVMVFNLDVNI